MTFYLTFFGHSIWQIFWHFSDIFPRILSDRYCNIPSGILSDIFSDIFSGILSDICCAIPSGILSDICEFFWHSIRHRILSNISSGIFSGMSSRPGVPSCPFSHSTHKLAGKQEIGQGEEEKKRGELPPLLKSRDPHLVRKNVLGWSHGQSPKVPIATCQKQKFCTCSVWAELQSWRNLGVVRCTTSFMWFTRGILEETGWIPIFKKPLKPLDMGLFEIKGEDDDKDRQRFQSLRPKKSAAKEHSGFNTWSNSSREIYHAPFQLCPWAKNICSARPCLLGRLSSSNLT